VVAEPPLGTRMHAMGMVLHGGFDASPHPPEEAWIEFLRKVAKAIGMSPVAEPVVFTYPLQGKGGIGQTVFMPISESFLALDTWSDHSGAYLLVCSCRSYASDDIDAVAAKFGLKTSHEPGQRFYAELNLSEHAVGYMDNLHEQTGETIPSIWDGSHYIDLRSAEGRTLHEETGPLGLPKRRWP
jgi:hypothetical protein